MTAVPSHAGQEDSGVESNSSLKVQIAYESFESGLEAVRLYHCLTKQFDQEFQFDVDFWRFEVLDIPAVGNQAAVEAEQADLVVIAIEGDHSLPVDVKIWIEKWIGKKAGQDSALVLLSRGWNGGWNENADNPNSVRAYLREIAIRGDMTFLFNSRLEDGGTKHPFSEELPLRALSSTSVMENLLSRRSPAVPWPSNEKKEAWL